jgi:precorrin-4/cobalt-precorrin-4 C11-methyltransferase
MLHPVYFVGAGPGDPELITVKGKRLIERADRIVYAGSLVPEALLEDRKPNAAIHNSAHLTLPETHSLLLEGHRADELVVRLHTGDPGLYGAIQEQMELLDRDGIPYEVVPGVSVVFAAAAKLCKELTLPETSQTVILTRLSGRTAVPEGEALASLASHRATMAIYLSVQQIEKVVLELAASYAADTPVVVAYRVGWPDEAFVHGTLESISKDVRAAGIGRQAIILVGDVFGAQGSSKKSRLYDEAFSHGFRDGRPKS